MDKLNVPGTTNGIPFNWDDLEFMTGQGSYDGGIIEAIEGILSAFDDNFIVQGCVLSGGNYTAGWLFLDGELLKVDAHAATDSYWEKVSSNNADGNKQTQLSGTVDIYQENRGVASASSGSLLADGNEPRWFAPEWTTISLVNSWGGGSNSARYRAHLDGTIELHLFIDTDLSGSISDPTLGVLPAGARPQQDQYFAISNTEGLTAITPRQLRIDTSGNIDIDWTATDIYKTIIRFPLT